MHIYQPLKQYINNHTTLTEKEWEQLSSCFKYRSVPAKFRLLDIGDLEREVYFILKGGVRFYYVKEGEEINAVFFFENSLVTVLDSFITQTPARQALETLEECELLVINREDFMKLQAENFNISKFMKSVVEMNFIFLQRRAASFILDSPEERYTAMLQNQPHLLTRVPQNMLASYLGITPVSLSRIRGRIQKS